MYKQVLTTALLLFRMSGLRAQEAVGTRTLNYKGNIIEMTHRGDTSVMPDPATKQETIFFQNILVVTKLNRMPVHQEQYPGSSKEYPLIAEESARLYSDLIRGIEPLFSGIEDGVYTIQIPAIIINEKGGLVYDSLIGLNSRWPEPKTVKYDVKVAINNKMAALLEGEKFRPMILDNIAVQYDIVLDKVIRVANHHIEVLN